MSDMQRTNGCFEGLLPKAVTHREKTNWDSVIGSPAYFVSPALIISAPMQKRPFEMVVQCMTI
jgi:hypothetical protein